MQGFWLSEVLVVNITSAGRIDPNEVVFSVILNHRISHDLPESCIESRDLFDGGLFFYIAYPVFRVTSLALFAIGSETVFGRSC